jgi:hypothetical protein
MQVGKLPTGLVVQLAGLLEVSMPLELPDRLHRLVRHLAIDFAKVQPQIFEPGLNGELSAALKNL